MKTKDMIASLTDKTVRPVFTPTRAAGLARLDLFAERAGDMYDRCRNYDLGPEQRANVSALSPWVRHRLITETEVLHSVLERHTFEAAERFVHEVFWRTYFKGWLEQHPSVWTSYQAGLRKQIKSVDTRLWGLLWMRYRQRPMPLVLRASHFIRSAARLIRSLGHMLRRDFSK